MPGKNGSSPEINMLDVLPHNREAEQAVLGSVLMGGAPAMYQVDPPLRPSDFYNQEYGKLWRLFNELGHPIDHVRVTDALERAGVNLSASELVEFTLATPTSVYVNFYADTVRRYSTLRRLIQAAQHIAQDAYAGSGEISEVWERARQEVEDAAPDVTDQALLRWKDTFTSWMGWMSTREEHRADAKVDLPWHALSFVRPLRAGMLAVVAANSGMGKTMFAENCAEHWARKGFRVALFHYELSHAVMVDRRVCRLSGEPMERIESGEITEAMMDAHDRAYSWPGQIHYVFCDGWPMTKVAHKARAMIRQNLADAVVVDYLQKAPFRERVRGMTTAQMRGQDCEILKSLAERERVPVMLLSQLNREAAHQTRKTRHTIRDTGEADEKANLVITLDRPILEKDMLFGAGIIKAGAYSPIVTVRVDKQTMGRTGDAKLIMDGGRFLLADVEADRE